MICKCGHPEERHANGPCKACVSRCRAFTPADNTETLRKDVAELKKEAKIKTAIVDNVISVNQTAYSASSSTPLAVLSGLIGVLVVIAVTAFVIVPVVTSFTSQISSTTAITVPSIFVFFPFAFIGYMAITGTSLSRMFRPDRILMVMIIVITLITFFPGTTLRLPIGTAMNESITFGAIKMNTTVVENISEPYGNITGNITLANLTVLVGNWTIDKAAYFNDTYERPTALEESDFCPNGTRFVQTECECAKKAREENRSTVCALLCGRCI